MDKMEYGRIIIFTLWSHFKFMLIVVFIAIILLLLEKNHYNRTKCNKGVTVWEMLGLVSFSYEKRFTLREQMWMKRILIVMCIFVMLWQAVPACLDVFREQYVYTSGIYHNNSDPSDRDFLSYGSVDFQTDSEKITLDLPYGWDTADYPVGSYYANIVYGKYTKLIVYVEVVSETNEFAQGWDTEPSPVLVAS